METFAPTGADATEIALGPLCTMVAQLLIVLHAAIVATAKIPFNIQPPGLVTLSNGHSRASLAPAFLLRKVDDVKLRLGIRPQAARAIAKAATSLRIYGFKRHDTNMALGPLSDGARRTYSLVALCTSSAD